MLYKRCVGIAGAFPIHSITNNNSKEKSENHFCKKNEWVQKNTSVTTEVSRGEARLIGEGNVGLIYEKVVACKFGFLNDFLFMMLLYLTYMILMWIIYEQFVNLHIVEKQCLQIRILYLYQKRFKME